MPWTIASVAWCLVAIAVVVWQFGGVTEGGPQLQVLNPDLALVWRAMIVALLMVDIAITLAVWYSRRWTPRLAVINVLVNIVGAAGIVVLLLQGHLLAPDLPQQLADVFDGYTGWRAPTVLIADAVIVIAAWDSIDCALKARHSVPSGPSSS